METTQDNKPQSKKAQTIKPEVDKHKIVLLPTAKKFTPKMILLELLQRADNIEELLVSVKENDGMSPYMRMSDLNEHQMCVHAMSIHGTVSRLVS